MTKIYMSIIFAAVGLKLTCGAILLSCSWPERAFIIVQSIHYWKANDFTTSGQQQCPEIRLIAKNAHIKHFLVVINAEEIITVKYVTFTVAKRKPDFNIWNSLSNFYWSLTWKCLLPVMCLYLTPFSSNAFAITTNTSCHYREMKHNMDSKIKRIITSGGCRERVRRIRTPPIRSDACLRLKVLHRQDRTTLFKWLTFVKKRALHFATKLNSKDIQKCNCFWVPSCDLFASASKAVFPAPAATGDHRLRNR